MDDKVRDGDINGNLGIESNIQETEDLLNRYNKRNVVKRFFGLLSIIALVAYFIVVSVPLLSLGLIFVTVAGLSPLLGCLVFLI